VRTIRFRVLGTAAGGGFPQWNCRCRFCEASRRGLIAPRLQASAALSSDGGSYYLLNATPDVTSQLARWPELRPQEGTRHTPIRGVLLTDAELDHTLGLLHLREGQELTIYATPAVANALEGNIGVLPALRCYTDTRVVLAEPGKTVILGGEAEGVRVEWLETGRDLPRYAGAADAPGAVTALELENMATGRSAVYAPGAGKLSDELRQRLERAAAILFDGTFWTEDEFPSVGGGSRSARDMGHLPIGGSAGSARQLAGFSAPVKRYVHINNTNPVLDPTSPQRGEIRQLGLEVAEDGEEVEF
jgi:pyrroloquinoline quinone biosynthesis protein B